jgi:flagellin-like hook-associated protein FlgL
MSDITLSSAVRSNLLSLQNTADLLGKTQERLSTGLKVNSALDNPTNFFTASSLNSRAGDLGRLLDGVANATQTLEAADNGIAAITDLVESAQASARQALQARGQETTSTRIGDASATFDPQALASVVGTGNNLTADAAATITSGGLTADATIGAFSTGDLDNGGTTAGDTALSGLASPLTNGESISLTVDDVDYTLSFTASGAASARGGDASNGFTMSIGVDQTLDDLQGALDTLLGGSDVSVAGADGDLTFTSTADVGSISLGDGATGATLTKLGLNTVGADSAAADGAGTRLLTQNSTLQALAAAGDSTLQINVGGTNAGTVTIGTGAGEVSTKDQLITALNNLSGVDVTGNAGDGTGLTFTNSDGTDADSEITITANNNSVLETTFGFTPDTTGGSVVTASPNNLLTQATGINAGETLSLQVGSSTALEVTFGTGTGQVSTLAELNTELRSLSGGAASVDDNGNLSVTADSGGDTVTIGGSANALSQLGVSAGEASTLIDGTNISAGDSISVQVGTNTAATITFGTGTGEVNTLDELNAALGNIAGASASVDDQTGAITIEATNGADSISVTGTNTGAGDEASILGAFGLTTGVTQSVTTDSATRTDLESQFNELLLQIDELAEDAGFNGVNLLDGDDLQVIFNEDGSSALDIDGENFNAAGLGLSSVASGDFQSDTNINSTLDTLDSAIQTLRSQASKFGSNLSIVQTREDFTNNMINTLETGAANLTLADTNEEGANLTALQTRQQLSTTSLSFATQADQNVLRLF